MVWNHFLIILSPNTLIGSSCELVNGRGFLQLYEEVFSNAKISIYFFVSITMCLYFNPYMILLKYLEQLQQCSFW